MADIKDKIRKLLALAESPCEGEARAALLKARELMAEHKLSGQDIAHLERQKVASINTQLEFTTLTNAWAPELGAIIADKYCCRALASKRPGGKTSTMYFVGLEDDVNVCAIVFRYAYEFILSEGENIKKRYKKFSWTGKQIREAREAYGFGFITGVFDAFYEQDQKNETWALVMKTPQAVIDELKRQNIPSKPALKEKGRGNDVNMLFRHSGYADGKKFDPSTKLNP